MEGLRIDGALQVQMQFSFREIEDKLLKIVVQLAGNGMLLANRDQLLVSKARIRAVCALFDIINVP